MVDPSAGPAEKGWSAGSFAANPVHDEKGYPYDPRDRKMYRESQRETSATSVSTPWREVDFSRRDDAHRQSAGVPDLRPPEGVPSW